MLFWPSYHVLHGLWGLCGPQVTSSRVLCRLCCRFCQLVVFHVDVDAFLRLNMFDSFLVCYFIAMCICVVLVGPLFSLFHFVFPRFASLRFASLDWSVLLLSSLCFVLLRLASLLVCLFGILVLPSPLSTSLSPAGWSYRYNEKIMNTNRNTKKMLKLWTTDILSVQMAS